MPGRASKTSRDTEGVRIGRFVPDLAGSGGWLKIALRILPRTATNHVAPVPATEPSGAVCRDAGGVIFMPAVLDPLGEANNSSSMGRLLLP
jgi:hypothetical protein